ncbi:DUF4139 domain-containing protein [Marinicella sp. W31]|uniref:DUF4139 domain-containing protein n=1 Tax=Marinicella sp. W31 TaxID=3023713 RepID=UPI0037583562
MADKTAITIYSTASPGTLDAQQLAQHGSHIPGYAMVKQERTVPIKKGAFEYAFTDVSAQIDPTTVTFTIPENPEIAHVLEQSYQFDLVNTEKLLQKYIDQNISVTFNSGDSSKTIEGTLLSASGGLVLSANSGQIVTLNDWQHIRYPSLPGGLLTKPTLLWRLKGQKNGDYQSRVTYQTQGITWWTDYNLLLEEKNNNCSFDLGAWVTIINQSGASYAQAQLKLIAGDVNRVSAPNVHPQVMMRSTAVAEEDTGFQEKAFFEYHLYTLQRPVDLLNNATKQLELMPAVSEVSCHKRLDFDFTRAGRFNHRRPITDRNYYLTSNAKAEVFIDFKNDTKSGLGIPLPAGRVRVNQLDSDGSVEFIGEDLIQHTPKNEAVSIKLGEAFDVVGERTQQDFQLRQNGLSETFRISLRNQKTQTQTVRLTEHLYRWSNWSIQDASHEHKKANASSIVFEVKIAPESEAIISYTVDYNWPQLKK